MEIPFVSFKPLERELEKEIREAFDRVFNASWYIEGKEDKLFEEEFAKYCNSKYCIGCGNCENRCQQNGIRVIDNIAVPNENCILCGYCATVCPEFCIKVI